MKKEQIKKEDLMNASGGMRVYLCDARKFSERVKNGRGVLIKYVWPGNIKDQFMVLTLVGEQDYNNDNQKQSEDVVFNTFENETEAMNYMKKLNIVETVDQGEC